MLSSNGKANIWRRGPNYYFVYNEIKVTTNGYEVVIIVIIFVLSAVVIIGDGGSNDHNDGGFGGGYMVF